MAFEGFPLGEVMNFPLRARQQKNQNFGQAVDFGGMVGGGIGDMIEQEKKKNILRQIVQAMKTQGAPQQGPPMPSPSMGNQIPSGQPMTAGMGNVGKDVQMSPPSPPVSGMGGPPQDNTKLLQSLMTQYDPQTAIRTSLERGPQNPLQKAQTDYYIARTNKLNQPPTASSGLTPQQDLRKQYIDAINKRTDVQSKSLNARQTDILSKTTNLPLQQLKMLTQNNIRADRALSILGKPNVTWQAANAALTDFAAMMQGGVPHIDQLHDAAFPSWKQKVASWKTFATGQPTANVPEPIRQEIMKMVSGVKDVDNQYLQQSQQNQMNLLGPTIQGFDQVKPFVEQGTKQFIQGGVKKNSSYDPGKEARYQEWKKSHGF